MKLHYNPTMGADINFVCDGVEVLRLTPTKAFVYGKEVAQGDEAEEVWTAFKGFVRKNLIECAEYAKPN